MSTLALVLTIIGGVLVVIGAAAALTAVYRTTAQDKTIERQRSEIGDYIRRLDYVEPKLHTLEQQNETLLRLHDPSADRAATAAEHAEIIRILRAQSATLKDIERNGLGGRSKP